MTVFLTSANIGRGCPLERGTRNDYSQSDYDDYGVFHMPHPNTSWTVADAKARFSEVVEKARLDGPQIITKNGRSTAVLVSIEEWERKTARSGSLAEFLLASPLRGAGLDLDRSKDEAREIEP